MSTPFSHLAPLLLLLAGLVLAQDKPRIGPDGRPLLNKPKVGSSLGWAVSRGVRLVQTSNLIGQEVKLSNSRPIRMSCQINKNALTG